jgi:hypothetical protein
MQIVAKCTGSIFGLIPLTDKPQCQLRIPTMLCGKLLDQIYQLLPARGFTFQTRDVPPPLWAPCNIELSDRQAPVEPIRVLLPNVSDLLDGLEPVVWQPALQGGDPLPLVLPDSRFTKLLDECMPCSDVGCLGSMIGRVRLVC